MRKIIVAAVATVIGVSVATAALAANPGCTKLQQNQCTLTKTRLMQKLHTGTGSLCPAGAPVGAARRK